MIKNDDGKNIMSYYVDIA